MIADFRDLLAAFVAAGVRFLVVGAHALAAHGVPRIDVMTSVSGQVFGEAWKGRSEATLFDVPVAFLGRDDLIRNKRASGRPKDLQDIEALRGGA